MANKKMKRTYTGSTSVITTRRTSDDSVTVYKDTYTDKETTFRKEQPGVFGILTSMTTYLIIFMLLLFGTSAVHYQNNQENLSWIDANGEFKASSYDLTVSYNLDTPLDELNGNSLNDVFFDNELFVNGQFENNTISPSYTSRSSYVLNAPYLDITSNNSANFYQFQQVLSIPASHDIFMISKVENLVGTWRVDVQVFDGSYPVLYNGINVKGYGKFTSLNTIQRIMLTFRANNSYDPASARISNIRIIDLTSLGINQTEDEMYYWYTEYQKLSQGNMLEDLKTLGAMPLASWNTMNEITRTLIDVYETGMKLVFPVVDAFRRLISLV